MWSMARFWNHDSRYRSSLDSKFYEQRLDQSIGRVKLGTEILQTGPSIMRKPEPINLGPLDFWLHVHEANTMPSPFSQQINPPYIMELINESGDNSQREEINVSKQKWWKLWEMIQPWRHKLSILNFVVKGKFTGTCCSLSRSRWEQERMQMQW